MRIISWGFHHHHRHHWPPTNLVKIMSGSEGSRYYRNFHQADCKTVMEHQEISQHQAADGEEVRHTYWAPVSFLLLIMLHLRRNVGLSLTDKMWTGLEFSMRLRVSSAYKYKWKIGRDTRPNILCIIEVNQRKPWQPWLQHNIIDLYICHQLIRKTTGNTARGRGPLIVAALSVFLISLQL